MTTFDPIACVTGAGFDANRGADPAFVAVPVAPAGASQPDVRPQAGSCPPSASVDGTETVTTTEHYDVAIGKPGTSDPRGNASRGPKPT